MNECVQIVMLTCK